MSAPAAGLPSFGAKIWSSENSFLLSGEIPAGSTTLAGLHFVEQTQDFSTNVFDFFKEHFVGLRILQDVLQAITIAGHRFYIGWNGRNGVLITDESDMGLARTHIGPTLDSFEKLRQLH
jgi:hypothetical protein